MKLDSRQAVLYAFKMRGCLDCGWRPSSFEELRGIDCDHRDPSTKKRFPYSSPIAATLEELWKCDPVCNAFSIRFGGHNCHRRRGMKRNRGEPDQSVLPLPIADWINETTRTWGKEA